MNDEWMGYQLEDAILSVGKGWATIITELWAKKPASIKVTTVKEKLGGLRVYFEGEWGKAPDIYSFEKAVTQAEIDAENTCEFCGKPGYIREDSYDKYHWYKSVCEEHKDWQDLKLRTYE